MSQLALFDTSSTAQSYDYGRRRTGERHGVVLTKPHIVDLILDLCGYLPSDELAERRLIDPACGEGVFLFAALDRLLLSTKARGGQLAELGASLAAFDVDPDHVERTRAGCVARLVAAGLGQSEAQSLAAGWVREADFLLTAHEPVDVVVGNPPYVRIEQVDPALQARYRRRFATLFDRADLYIAFFERGLELLRPGGQLGFICADRWTSNRYGSRLRRLLGERAAVRTYIDLQHASPFESEVIAYPSIVTIEAGAPQGRVAVGRLERADAPECAALAEAATHGQSTPSLSWRTSWFRGGEPWVVTSRDQLQVLRALETRWPALQDSATGTRVGIGVATGADAAFIVPSDADIESDRLLPLVRREDLGRGIITDAGRCVLNTFCDSGRPIDLDDYPRLARHLRAQPTVAARYVARKQPRAWFRTIDRVFPELVARPKLLIPDIAGANEVTLDPGRYYPHHNLYHVTSTGWDLEVLGALLSSKVALFFVWSYGTKMRGDYLRFQAQYLRRIRVPQPEQLAPALRLALADAYRRRDFPAIDALAVEAYELAALPDFDLADRRA